MRAAVFKDGGLRVAETAAPTPGPGEALVKTRVCGICGSDLHFTKHACHVAATFRRIGSPFPIDLSREIVMGHEFCGEVVEAPSDGAGPPVGALVCSMPFTVVGAQAQLVGYSADRPGGFGQYMALGAASLVPVGNGLSAEHAALTEPLAVGWHAVQRGRAGPGDVALVVGCGPIGLAVVAALKVAGVHAIVAADFNPRRRHVARAMGADVVVDPADHSPYADWAGLAFPPGYDPASLEALFKLGQQPRPTLIFECVGVPGMIQRVFEGALPGTRVVVVGVCMEGDTFEPLYPLNKETDVHFAFFYTAEEFAQTLRHLEEGRINAAPMLSRTVGLDGVKPAFDALAGGGDDIKVLVDPWR